MRETLSIAVLMIFLAVAGGGQPGAGPAPSCMAPLTTAIQGPDCRMIPLVGQTWPQQGDAQAFQLAVLK